MDARTTWPALLSALIRGDSLTADESEWAMNEIMEGVATPSQIAGFGVALRIKGTSVAEMTGLARSMLAHATPISLPGQLTDLVGTGGDGARTVNVSTMGTIVAAAAGARMIKHGNRAASSACGAAAVLDALGVVIALPPASLGLPLASVADLRGGDAVQNAAVVRAVLAGERGPVRDIVLLNAAAALAAAAGVAGPEAVVPALADGYARAAEAVDSGAASALLDRWIEVSRRLAPPLPSR